MNTHHIYASAIFNGGGGDGGGEGGGAYSITLSVPTSRLSVPSVHYSRFSFNIF